MSNEPLQAHSVIEIRLYLKVATCENCGGGPLRCDELIGEATPPAVLTLLCARCAATRLQPVHLVHPSTSEESKDTSVINPSVEPSAIIDLGQWLVLVSLLGNEAASEPDRRRARDLGIQASRCIDEALKFFADADNDLPPPEAFFRKESRRRFHDSPEQFSRQRIAGMLKNLPRPYTPR